MTFHSDPIWHAWHLKGCGLTCREILLDVSMCSLPLWVTIATTKSSALRASSSAASPLASCSLFG